MGMTESLILNMKIDVWNSETVVGGYSKQTLRLVFPVLVDIKGCKDAFGCFNVTIIVTINGTIKAMI